MRRKWVIAAAAVVLCGGGYLAWRVTHPRVSDEERIHRVLDQVERGIETKDPRMVLATIADDYRDGFGFTKRDLHRLVLGLPRTAGTISVTIDDVEIEVRNRQADVALRGLATLEQAGERQEFAARLTVRFEKQRRQWLIIAATGWQDAAGEALE